MTTRATSCGLIVVCAFGTFPSGASQPPDPQTLRLVPFPREIRRFEGGLIVTDSLILRVAGVVPAPQAAEDLRGEIPLRTKVDITFKVEASVDGQPNLLWLGPPAMTAGDAQRAIAPLPEQDEGYTLVVTEAFAAVGARQPAGLAHGVQTLRQLVRANLIEGRIPAVSIRDWPGLRYRGFSDDITRGPSPTPATLRREIDLCSLLRMNFYTYYLESQYAFRKHPDIGPPDGSLTPDELRGLVAYATRRGVEVIGNQQSFGHFTNILRHEKYKDLRETMWVLNPTNEKTYELLDDLYSEQAPLLPSKLFNVCCDETEGLGTGPSRELAARIGVGGVYTRHLQRLHDLLRDKYGKRMMMWGDIILNHPDHLKDIPKDTVMLSWGYDARESFDSAITPFAKSGYEFFVCPGVSCWNRVLPDFQVSVTNIRNYVRDGAKLGALGMLNTTWDDSGENLAGPSWYGIAWGAECAWNASSTPVEAFNQRVGAVLFGEEGSDFGKAVELLGTAHRLPVFGGMLDRTLWQVDFAHWLRDETAAAREAESLRSLVRQATQHLDRAAETAVLHKDVLEQVRSGARRMELMATRILDGRDAAAAYRKAAGEQHASEAVLLLTRECTDRVRAIRNAYAELREEYIRLWNGENRPYALDVVTRRFDAAIAYHDDLLSRLASAAEDLKHHRPLPSPEQIGFSGGGAAKPR